jgi:nucleotide-binding universal stress UspA family protein/amino acid transporter
MAPTRQDNIDMAHVTHKLSNSLEGALAGGGDPATSPLYVFGPFLKLIVVAGVAQVTFGASVWMVILTIAVVSAMYRLVMRWVTDGSGGSGLSEEEFGGWAVKVNAAITFIEYTLTFLVSMAAMVTFIADRIPILNEKILWIQYRTLVAIALSVLTGWLVNRGPRMAARTFGPATAGVLILLWAMVFASIWHFKGIVLPDFNFEAFSLDYLEFTIGGYVRILAVMTGIEVFANLVAAYDGTPKEMSKKAFNSLLIIMGTTGVTMIIVGPAILSISDPSNAHVSVFTQTMDQLLPSPLPIFGTIVGVAVLMSASAASAQGLQNLALGLKERRYIPPVLGQPNRFEVADKPVWIEVGIVSFCFLLFGTHEETYLAIYAAGVFILLSMTGWAVTKRLIREVKEEFKVSRLALIFGTIIAALVTSAATIIIFEERFFEGAWTYFLLIPLLYMMFTYSRNRLGEPSPEMDYLGQLDAAQLAGFGFGQMAAESITTRGRRNKKDQEVTWQPDPKERSHWREERASIEKLVVLLDGSDYAALALPWAKSIAKVADTQITLLSSVKNQTQSQKDEFETTRSKRETYLEKAVLDLAKEGFRVNFKIKQGFITQATSELIEEDKIDIVITSTRGKSGAQNWLTGGVSRKLIHEIDKPVLLVTSELEQSSKLPKIERLLVALDGSIKSEQVLPYARLLGKLFKCELILISVPAVPRVENYRAAADVVEAIRDKAVKNMQKFLEAVARSLREEGLNVRTIVSGSMPARTIVETASAEDVDMILITSRGRGGLDYIMIGSVAQRILENTQVPVFIVPVLEINSNNQEL